MPNCRPGDLAIFVRATHPYNIGKIVRVLSPGGDLRGTPSWWVRSSARLKWVDRHGRVRWLNGDVRVEDFKLQPIRGQARTARAAKKPKRVSCLTIRAVGELKLGHQSTPTECPAHPECAALRALECV